MFARQRMQRSKSIEAVDPGPIETSRAAILHLDIVGSTGLVRRDLRLAHLQVSRLYQRICRISEAHHGHARELRGDAAVLEFARASDAVRAARAIHATGISFGEIISERRLITGEAVIRAQRIEQLAEPGEVWFDDSVFRRLEPVLREDIKVLPTTELKGFAGRAALYRLASICGQRPDDWQQLFRPLVA